MNTEIKRNLLKETEQELEIEFKFKNKEKILVSSMDKEDDKLKVEIFLDKEKDSKKIEKLLKPKSFDNFKFFNKENSGNLLIKGDNLIALHSLKHKYKNKIDVIYIDPPYYFNDTRDSDSFAYNSNFKLSTWLVFMKNRLEIAKQLLSETGVIFISMNEDGNSYLKILCDEIFGANNFIGNFMWAHGKGKKDNFIRTTHQNNICYSKTKNNINYSWEEEVFVNYSFSNPDKDPKGPWFSGSISFSEERSNILNKNYFSIISPSGIIWKRQWQKTEQEINTLIEQGNIYFGEYPDYKNVPREKIRPNQKIKIIPSNYLTNCGTTKSAENTLKDLFGNIVFSYPKPVELIKYLIKISTNNKYSIILDFFGGSGTTGHAVMDLNKEDCGNRKFIMIEQMDYIETITAERLKRAIVKYGYEEGFDYFELKETSVKRLKKELKSLKTEEELNLFIENNFIDSKEEIFLILEEIKKSIKSKRVNKIHECIKFLLINYIPCEYDYEIFGEHSCDKTKEFYSKSI